MLVHNTLLYSFLGFAITSSSAKEVEGCFFPVHMCASVCNQNNFKGFDRIFMKLV